jgi:hypothetical protein
MLRGGDSRRRRATPDGDGGGALTPDASVETTSMVNQKNR